MSVTWIPQPLDIAVATLQLPAPGTPMTPQACQQLALLIAYRGRGQVAPNPLVGAVCVDAEHRFLSAGAHERIGTAHAEVHAMAAATAAGLATKLKGGTLYVTLEPCAHANRTPACAPQVAVSGLSHVVYGIVDPNPRVQGRGIRLLQEAGLRTTLDPNWSPACAELAEIFLWNLEHQRPFVGLKVAASLNAVIARPGDQRAWITGPRARAYGHFLRTYYDALIIGRGTLLADDPILDSRDALQPGRTPRRVVLDAHGAGLLAREPSAWRLLSHAPEGVLWLTGEALPKAAQARAEAVEKLGATWLRLPLDTTGRIPPKLVLEALRAAGVSSLLIEGGSGVYRAFLEAKAVNRLHLFQAPKILDGHGALSFSATGGELRLASMQATPLDGDLLLSGLLA